MRPNALLSALLLVWIAAGVVTGRADVTQAGAESGRAQTLDAAVELGRLLFWDPILSGDRVTIADLPEDPHESFFGEEEAASAGADALSGASVTGRIVGITKGPKINGFTYKRRTNQRRRYGHRQKYTVVEIVSITKS